MSKIRAPFAYICNVSFLYPLFLFAGLAVALPILIHLFNLRRYRTVYFPHTRFLKSIRLLSQKQSQLRYRLLLSLRILFLLFLVLAFAQPFFSSPAQQDTTGRLQIIYIDNALTASLKNSRQTVLDIMKNAARRQLQQAVPTQEFVILTNGTPPSYRPVPVQEAMALLQDIDILPVSQSPEALFTSIQGLIHSEAASGADIYYYSDFRDNAFPDSPDPTLLQDIRFFGIPVRGDALQNAYIDTAFLTMPVLQTDAGNALIVKSRYSGKPPVAAPVIQLSVDGQVRNMATPTFDKEGKSTDTLQFSVSGAGWKQVMLTINDGSLPFDDTFRMAARSAAALSVLILNEKQPNPFLQAAFRTAPGFRVTQADIAAIPADLRAYNLVILSHITRMDESLIALLADALEGGQSLCIFPGKTPHTTSLSDGLQQLAGIRITGTDTVAQTAGRLLQESELVKDVFASIPENVQLPVANWHYQLESPLAANEQAVLSFRNGDPFFAQYTPSRGKLYLCATAIDAASGNFPASYFFVPFLYKMAVQGGTGDVYVTTTGSQQPIFIPAGQADERNMVHVYGGGIDIIPPQRPAGAGLDISLGQVIRTPGFYTLAAKGTDTIVVALNADRSASALAFSELSALKERWQGEHIRWTTSDNHDFTVSGSTGTSFPLWKVCIILAVLMLAAETLVLAGSFRKQTVASL